MGSATREALTAARAELSTRGGGTLAISEELFSAGRVIGESAQLRTLLTESNADSADKIAVLAAVFAQKLSAPTLALLGSIVANRWSDQDDLLAGIEELGLRAAADSVAQSVSIEAELFAFGTAVSSDPSLELAIGSKVGSDTAKTALIIALIGGKASAQTVAIIRQLVLQPRGRRIGELLKHAAFVVADQVGLRVATVTSATTIAPAQLDRLKKGLAQSYGREISVNLVIDPSIIGGLRVQVGDDVIDGSVARKLSDLRAALVH